MCGTMASDTVAFVKMQGAGNDFVVVDNRDYGFSEAELSAAAEAWCSRRYGVGADGLLALVSPRSSAADCRMCYWNADGSRATMCGNGARCFFRFARRRGVGGSALTFETDAGLYRAVQPGSAPDTVRLFVPDVTDVRPRFQLEGPVPAAIRALTFVHSGTEHLVATVDDLAAAKVAKWGRQLRHDAGVQPTGANVNFLELGPGRELRVRTYEKGVEAETPACGTGVLAAAVAVERTRPELAARAVPVRTRGGDLRVGRAPTDQGKKRYLEGPAAVVFRGQVQLPAASSSTAASQRADASRRGCD
jgi:diaminopimelate epimerase